MIPNQTDIKPKSKETKRVKRIYISVASFETGCCT